MTPGVARTISRIRRSRTWANAAACSGAFPPVRYLNLREAKGMLGSEIGSEEPSYEELSGNSLRMLRESLTCVVSFARENWKCKQRSPRDDN